MESIEGYNLSSRLSKTKENCTSRFETREYYGSIQFTNKIICPK